MPRSTFATPTAEGSWPIAAIGCCALVGLMLAAGGCRSRPEPQRIDSRIERYAESGAAEFAEGLTTDAVTNYRRALRRAWLLDDPVEIAHAAYNLSACLGSLGRLAEARDWLHEARAEFARAGRSDRNTWLLEAKLAAQMGLYDEALMLTRRAEWTVHCTRPPCPPCPHPSEPVAECDPCYKPKSWKDRRELRQQAQRRADLFELQLHLTRAAVAAEAGDFALASRELNLAAGWLNAADDLDSRAEFEHLWGVVLLFSGSPQDAVPRFDLEAEMLRVAGNHREITTALRGAATACEAAGDLARAADRRFRVARILYARGQYLESLEEIRLAVDLAEVSGNQPTQARLALLFREVDEAVRAAERAASAQQDSNEVVPPPKPDDKPTIEAAPASEPAAAIGRLPEMPWKLH